MRVFYKCIHKEQYKKRKFCVTAISAKLSEVLKTSESCNSDNSKQIQKVIIIWQ